MKIIKSSNYNNIIFGIKRESQQFISNDRFNSDLNDINRFNNDLNNANLNNNNVNENDLGNEELDNSLPLEKPSKDYFASIGVRIRVVPQKNIEDEKNLAALAFKEIREQIQNGVNEDLYEAWLSGYDEEPKTESQLMASKNNAIKTSSHNGSVIIKKSSQIYDAWNYKGHDCRIELESEYDDKGNIDVTKVFHYVKLPSEKEERLADLGSYDKSRKVVENWIDAGYPERNKSIYSLFKKKNKKI